VTEEGSQMSPLAAFGEAEFQELANNAPVLIWRSGTDKRCDWFNKPWLDFVGRSMEQEVGYGWTDGVHKEDLDYCVAIYSSSFDARKKFGMTYRMRRADGEYRYLMNNGAPFYRNDEFAGYFGSCTDVTAQKELESQHLRTLLAELQHRVRNNLQLILGFLSLQASRAKGDEARSVLEAASARVQGVGAVQDRLSSAVLTRDVDLADYLPALVKDVAGTDVIDRIEITIDICPARVTLDQASAVGLIINELLTNAQKHAFKRGTGSLRVEARRKGDEVEISVTDTGPGFSSDAIESSGKKSSTGFGLMNALAGSLKAKLEKSNANGAEVKFRFKPTALNGVISA
jgi:PAS domain S-box-containing protein